MEGEQTMRTVRVWVDDDFIEFEVEDVYESESELYEDVWEYVMNAITIEIV